MVKLHTRLKRKMSLTTSKPYGRNKKAKKVGAKTFPTEEKAKEYADKNKIKGYTIVPAKRNKRFKVSSAL